MAHPEEPTLPEDTGQRKNKNINNVLHDISRFLLSEIQTSISQSQISKVVFQICTDIFSSLNVVTACLGNQKRILGSLNSSFSILSNAMPL